MTPHGQRCSGRGGLDDDCNGAADEGLDLGGCDTGFEGVCAIGQEVCEGADGIVCVADVLLGTVEESCNTLDDDCNGSPDDGGIFD